MSREGKLKISVALLTFSLLYLGVAEVQQLDHQAGEGSSIKIVDIEPVSVYSGDTAGSQENYCQLAATVKELKDKLKNRRRRRLKVRTDCTKVAGFYSVFACVSLSCLTFSGHFMFN